MAAEKQDQSARRLVSPPVRHAIEQCVSAYLGKPWQATHVRDMIDFSSHPAALMTDQGYTVFTKLYNGPIAQDQLAQELAGLRLLTARSGVRTPVIIDNLPVEGGGLVVMEAVEVVERERSHWRQIGQALARIHSAKWDRCGLETHVYWGGLYQDNTPLADWPQFFWERRIVPRLKAAVDAVDFPRELAAQIEKLEPRLARLCGPKTAPALLHGDAQQNNILSTANGPVFIDPAVYYGHPEVDLAFVDFFAPVSDELFRGYEEIALIDPGFAQRRDLWLIPAWLAMVELDGPQHLAKLAEAVRRYA